MPQAEHVGILALELYLPRRKVLQSDFEAHDGCVGKYTVGLGQVSMSYCSDRQDVISLALTAVHRLLEKYDVNPARIGRLEVGTESSIDRSKSIKSHLMRIFQGHNHQIEGVDCIHGCYGATAALFNAVNWAQSRSWDGQLALVVATDVALYAPGSSARATGGCGAVALLVGPDAPLVVDPAWQSHFADHTYEFCKPAGQAPYPVVDGPATVFQFLRAVDCCYSTVHGKLQRQSLAGQCQGLLNDVDHFICHAPFNKMVRKATSRLHYQDMLRNRAASLAQLPQEWQDVDPDNMPSTSYNNKQLEKLLQESSSDIYNQKGAALEARRLLLFAFGSGVMASMFSLIGRNTNGPFTLTNMANKLHLAQQLAQQAAGTPQDFNAASQLVEKAFAAAPYEPQGPMDEVQQGAYYLQAVDEHSCRSYARKL